MSQLPLLTSFYLFIISIKRTPLLSGQKSCHDRCPLIGDFTVYIMSDAFALTVNQSEA
jgi:hypothetical protein